LKRGDEAGIDFEQAMTAPRPLKLLPNPEPIAAVAEIPDGPPRVFRWRRVPYLVTKASGPERIADAWRTKSEARPARDYYRVEDEAGRRFWIYREGFYGEEPAPKWFLHGFFG
jgi:protein ImuB